MRLISAVILLLLGSFTGTALAADAVTPTGGSVLDLTRPIFDAIVHGQGWAAAAGLVVLLMTVVRGHMPAAWKDGVKGDIIGTAVTFALAFAGAIFTWAVAPGATMTMAVLLTATKVGVAAIGGYTIIHKVLGWAAAWGVLPAWLRPMLTLLATLIGSSALQKAQAAGDAAVKQNPPAGAAEGDKIIEVE